MDLHDEKTEEVVEGLIYRTKTGTSPNDDQKNLEEEMYKLRHCLKFIYVITVMAILVIFKFISWYPSSVSNEGSASSNAPEIKNESLSDAQPFRDKTLHAVEKFRIIEKNINLIPGHPQELDIELDPTDADKTTLEYNSTNAGVVRVENGNVIASEELKVGIYYVDIIIKATKTGYEDTVHVKVDNSITPNSSDILWGGDTEKETFYID